MRPASVLLALVVAAATATAQRPGTVSEHVLHSKVLERDRRLTVYLPDGYPDVCPATGCSVLVMFDAAVYTSDIDLPASLDRLIASKRIPAVVALLVENESGATRIGDLGNRAVFARFMGEEVIPWLRAGWRVTRDPSHVVISGSSAGGLGAAFVAFKRPDLFGNVLSQSGAFWRGAEASNDEPYEWLTAQYQAAPRARIRFFMDVGARETSGALGGAAPSIVEANRHLRDVLKAKGYAVDYFEVPNGVHSPEAWKERLPVGLAALLK